MRKVFLLTMCFPLLFLSSCKWLGKTNNKDIEVLIMQKQELERRVKNDSLNYAREMASVRMEYEQKLKAFEEANLRSATGFFVIVGSFKDPQLAESFSAKVKSQGLEGNIIEGPNNFTCVTYATFKNLRESLPVLATARTSVTPDAWILFR